MWTALIARAASLFGGSRLVKWLVAGIAAVAIVAAFGWILRDNAHKDAALARANAANAALRSAHAASRAALAEMEAADAAKEAALAEREKTISAINADRAALRRRWQEALRHDETVRDWADTPLPDAVRGMLR
ncbi:hypothetical protein [Pseudodesulfovibrio tunisiensis]|uniref:hypothetical protein n=1 Tax=Pseudodesulfovibrio tunisiensis TaxID=463192 RepID=UPI001FB437EF|nr:hypothetical protein [Pseudodesulfovibrio tunisiensis]